MTYEQRAGSDLSLITVRRRHPTQMVTSFLNDAEQGLILAGHNGESETTFVTNFFFLHDGVNDVFDLAFGQLVSPTKLHHIDHTIFHFAEHRAVGIREKLSRSKSNCDVLMHFDAENGL